MEPASCQEFRAELLASGAEPSDHARSCAACARWAARRVRREELVRSLPRVTAPKELDGRTVAALQAGARQERAIEALQELERLQPPRELDRAVAHEAGAPSAAQPERAADAPSVLDRLVAEELADPAKARTRRFVGSLPRLMAPSELDARVAAHLAQPRPAARSRFRLAWVSAVAAALILALATPILLQHADQGRARRSFRVERVPSLGALDAQSRGWLDTASGGLLSLHKI